MCGNKVVQGGLTTQKEGWAAVIFPNVRMVVKERVCVLNNLVQTGYHTREREREREEREREERERERGERERERERESESERESIE